MTIKNLIDYELMDRYLRKSRSDWF